MASPMRRRRPSTLAWPGFDLPDWFGRSPRWRGFPDLDEMEAGLAAAGMRIEERMSEGELVIRAEMPGIDPDEDVEITVGDGLLTISAERREEKKEEGDDGPYRSEFHYGRFSRTVPLPAGATREDVKASYTDGILEIHVPVSDDEDAARKIPISRG